MKWYLATPFSKSKDDQWLGAFVPGNAHSFESVPAIYEHDRSRRETDGLAWRDYAQHGLAALRAAGSADEPSGLITCFPQLPLVIGARQRLGFRPLPVVAWAFNLGHLPGGLKRGLSKFAFHRIDRFVVHSRAEVTACSEWLQLPTSRFTFVPLQRAVIEGNVSEDSTSPFILAMGSAGRDYRLLFDVLTELKYRAVVVAGAHAVEGLSVPDNVEIKYGLTIAQCHDLLQQACFSVTPIRNVTTASGQVTLIDAMMYGRAQVVTSCPGSVDYLTHGQQALMVPPGDREALRSAIQLLWQDKMLRHTMGRSGRQRMVREFSDDAAGRRLGSLLDEVERDHRASL
jgi:hypothetical protein